MDRPHQSERKRDMFLLYVDRKIAAVDLAMNTSSANKRNGLTKRGKAKNNFWATHVANCAKASMTKFGVPPMKIDNGSRWMSRGGVIHTNEISCVGRSDGSNIELQKTIRFGVSHEDSANTIVVDHFAFITDMLFCETADRFQIPPKIRHI